MAPETQRTSDPVRIDWGSILDSAGRGARSAALQACDDLERDPEPFPGAYLFLRGRCLAELGEDLPKAVTLLGEAIEVDPANVLTPPVLAFAWLRSGEVSRAADFYREHGLPHDDELLGQIMLTIELAGRPWPTALPEGWPPWPALLGPDPHRYSPPMDEDAASEPPPPPKLGRAESRQLAALMRRLEDDFMERPPLQLAREVSAAMGAGLNSSDLHLLGGLANEEGGDAARARAHLALSLDLEPGQTIARTLLGRVYWRHGWNDIAEAVWRNLPVEGPDDFGRHYHMALLHASKGDRASAAEAMRVALHDFYVDTREIFIERVFRRWLRQQSGDESS